MGLIENDVTARIAFVDNIATSAIGSAKDLDSVFSDLTALRPTTFSPAQAIYTPGEPTLVDSPARPDDARIALAETELGKVSPEISAIDAKKAEVDQYFTAFDSTLAEVRARLPLLMALADGIVSPAENDLSFTEGDYQADNQLDATLKSIIRSEIAKDGEGYSDATETAIYNTESERTELARQTEIDTARESQCGRGFSMPQGFLMEAVHQINEKYRLIDEKKSKDTMLLQTKLSLDNKWKALNAGITYNQIILAYVDTKAQRALEVALAVLNLKMNAIKFRTDMARQRLAAVKAGNQSIIDGIKIAIERYGFDIMKYRKNIDSLIVMAKGYIEQYKTKGYVYGIEVAEAAEKSKLRQGEAALSLAVQKSNIMRSMTVSEEALRAYLATAGIKLNAAGNGADVQRAIVVATLNSLSTIINRLKSGEKATNT